MRWCGGAAVRRCAPHRPRFALGTRRRLRLAAERPQSLAPPPPPTQPRHCLLHRQLVSRVRRRASRPLSMALVRRWLRRFLQPSRACLGRARDEVGAVAAMRARPRPQLTVSLRPSRLPPRALPSRVHHQVLPRTRNRRAAVATAREWGESGGARTGHSRWRRPRPRGRVGCRSLRSHTRAQPGR